MKSRKMLMFRAGHLETMSLAGRQISPIDVNFHLPKSLEIFDKNSADKICSKKDKGVESALPHANWG